MKLFALEVNISVKGGEVWAWVIVAAPSEKRAAELLIESGNYDEGLEEELLEIVVPNNEGIVYEPDSRGA